MRDVMRRNEQRQLPVLWRMSRVQHVLERNAHRPTTLSSRSCVWRQKSDVRRGVWHLCWRRWRHAQCFSSVWFFSSLGSCLFLENQYRVTSVFASYPDSFLVNIDERPFHILNKLPPSLELAFELDDEAVVINLTRSPNFRQHLPVFTGNFDSIEEILYFGEIFSLYSDDDVSQASVVVKKKEARYKRRSDRNPFEFVSKKSLQTFLYPLPSPSVLVPDSILQNFSPLSYILIS